MSRPRLYSIAPHSQFLELLCERILDGTLLGDWPRRGPFWLSDITILLPTKRARLELADIFARRRGGATLLPDIRALGAEPGEGEAPFLPLTDVPPAHRVVGVLERRLVLSHLVNAFARTVDGFASPPSAAEVFWLADSLGTLIDDFIIEGVDPGRLADLVPDELAVNWQQTLGFLRIAFEAWPAELSAANRIDAADARNRRLRQQAASAKVTFADRPVIAAGSTGSIPATAELLAAIAALPRGAVVLPGLDTSLSADQHRWLIESDNAEGHAQYGLMKLLRRLGAAPAEVEELAAPADRTRLVRDLLSPAPQTADWGTRRDEIDLDAALSGVGIVAASTPDMQARAIALAARQAVVEGKRVGIVSRDQTLARRISVELDRHGIEIDDPAGTPLYQSPAGRLARQALAVAVDDFAPVSLVALLRNAAVTLGRDRADVQRQATRLDLRLRRERTLPGLAGVLALVHDDELTGLLQVLGTVLGPLVEIVGRSRIDAVSLAAALDAATTALRDGRPLPGDAEFSAWRNGMEGGSSRGTEFTPVNLDAVLKALMEGVSVPPAVRRRNDIHIWGELEARLMNPDLMILAGLNEDIWPAPADPGPWLNRKMRVDVGLEPPERQQGLAAHDFEMAIGNANVLLAYATRQGTSPATPSRFVQRLDAYVGESRSRALRARGSKWLEQAAAIDFAGLPRPARRPEPMPEAAIRPRELSVTEVETLMRSPYDIYARRVLRLRRIDPLGTEPNARDRGTMIHQVFEKFVTEGRNFSAPDAAEQLLEMAREAFRNLESITARRDIWLQRFSRSAVEFLAWERTRHGRIAARAAEITGAWILPSLENFVLVGKADRIDQRTDGLLEILDFKTGGVPAPKDMTGYEAPQLLLEAAMARAGAFGGIQPRDTAALTYIKIGLGPQAFVLRSFSLRKGMRLMEAVDEMERRVQGHIEAFLIRDSLPMLARLRPRADAGRKPRPGDYDHLARTDEWTLTSGVDDP